MILRSGGFDLVGMNPFQSRHFPNHKQLPDTFAVALTFLIVSVIYMLFLTVSVVAVQYTYLRFELLK